MSNADWSYTSVPQSNTIFCLKYALKKMKDCHELLCHTSWLSWNVSSVFKGDPHTPWFLSLSYSKDITEVLLHYKMLLIYDRPGSENIFKELNSLSGILVSHTTRLPSSHPANTCAVLVEVLTMLLTHITIPLMEKNIQNLGSIIKKFKYHTFSLWLFNRKRCH